jgi:lysozyme
MPYLDEGDLGVVTAYLRQWEGVRLESYQDSAGVWTIGVGHTRTAAPGMRISSTAADQLLIEDLQWVDECMGRTIKVEISRPQKAAIASLIFNIGAAAWRSSTALKRLNAGDFDGCAEAMTWWNKVTINGQKVVLPGLAKRREEERQLFLGTSDIVEDFPTNARAEANEVKSLTVSKEMGISVFGLMGSIMAMWERAQEVFPPEILEPMKQWAPVALMVLFGAIAGNRLWARYVGAR